MATTNEQWMAQKPEGISDAVWKFIGDRPQPDGTAFGLAILVEEAVGIQREVHEKDLHALADYLASYRNSARSEMDEALKTLERARADAQATSRAIDRIEDTINRSKKRGVVL